jgi:DNA-directed RNA polymerase specialized sigma24 family protein
MTRDWVLSQEALDALLARLDPDPEPAGEKYEQIRHRLIKFFEWRRCRDAEQCADETINRVARKIAGGEQIRLPDPSRYFFGVAQNVYREMSRRKPREVTVTGLATRVRLLVTRRSPRDECVRRCLNDLPPESRELLEAYYLDGRARFAAALGVTTNAVSLRVFKAKKKLKTCIRKCLDP